ncbi:putative antirepressor protein [Actinobacillus minor NM305]|uniref:Putative antirepressor protein n=1 Tax=Actinobacillus minor NM305 TaxID=637911 RepID=C5S5A2_9PAST|nr:Bro-N domain-containing protein [Actinobacillus minor]EER45888.1 putative antirepressor protein [Actinobacillus minor NM305]MDY5105599.1 Bro-N domain-containing protein [Actinobacillus minor]
MSQSTQLSTFNFEKSSIRVIAVNNEPWFVAKDVCNAIGLSNSRMALLALDDDEKGVSSTYTLGGEQDLAIVSESGMYTLILRCRDAVKKGSVPHRFRKWVTAEVLPQIRKTGRYQVSEKSQPKEQEFTHNLKNSEAVDLAWLWFEAEQMVSFIGKITPALEVLGSHLAPTAHSIRAEYGSHIKHVGKLIYRLSVDADFGRNPRPMTELRNSLKQNAIAVRRDF